MSLPIISAQQRLAERKGVKLLMLGKSGIGKTTRLKDLDPATTLFVPQIEGSKTSLELPGIVDEVVTLAELKADDGASYRAFVCHTLNAWGYPAKDRSGRLDPIEEPHLGRLMEKIAGPARPATERLDFARPAPAAIPESTSTQES